MHHIGGGEGGILEGYIEGAGAAEPNPLGKPQLIAESTAGVDEFRRQINGRHLTAGGHRSDARRSPQATANIQRVIA